MVTALLKETQNTTEVKFQDCRKELDVKFVKRNQ